MADNPFASIGVTKIPASGGSSPVPAPAPFNPFAGLGLADNPVLKEAASVLPKADAFKLSAPPVTPAPTVASKPVVTPKTSDNPFASIGVPNAPKTPISTLKDTVLGSFPFADTAKGYLGTLDYESKDYSKTGQIVSSAKAPKATIQGGEYDSSSKNVSVDTGNNKYPQDQQQIVMAHEMLNALYPQSPAAKNPAAFNSAWDNLKKNSEDPAVRQSLTDIDNHMAALGYTKLGTNALNSSRFSYLAQEANTNNGADIPAPLRSFYSGIINFAPPASSSSSPVPDFQGFKDANGNAIPIHDYTPEQRAEMDANNQALQKRSEVFNSPAGKVGAFLGSVPEAAAHTAVGIAQIIPRALGSVALSADKAISKVTGLPEPGTTPNSGLTHTLFGDEPLESIGQRGRDLQVSLGQDPTKTINKIQAPLFGLGITLADLLPLEGGGTSRGKGMVPETFIKYLAEEKSPVKIAQTLKDVGVGPANAETLASRLAPAKTTAEVGDVLEAYSTLGKKPTGETGPIATEAKDLSEIPNSSQGDKLHLALSQGFLNPQSVIDLQKPIYHGVAYGEEAADSILKDGFKDEFKNTAQGIPGAVFFTASPNKASRFVEDGTYANPRGVLKGILSKDATIKDITEEIKNIDQIVDPIARQKGLENLVASYKGKYDVVFSRYGGMGEQTDDFIVLNKDKMKLSKAISTVKPIVKYQDTAGRRLTEKYPDVHISINEDPKEIQLHQLVVPEDMRGQGTGSKMMTDLVNYADEKNKSIVLTPSEEFGGDKARLVALYNRFGFIAQGDDMVRPSSSQTSKKQAQVDLLHRQIQRTADSLRSALANPEGHAKAYPTKTPAVYRARISELNTKLDALLTNTGPGILNMEESGARSDISDNLKNEYPTGQEPRSQFQRKGIENSAKTEMLNPTPKQTLQTQPEKQSTKDTSLSSYSYNKNSPLNTNEPSTAKSMAELLRPVKTTVVDKTRNIPVPRSALPPKFIYRKIDLGLKKEDVQNSPYKKLIKYLNKDGRLPEVTGKSGGSYFAQHGDEIIQSAFPYSETYGNTPDVENVRANMEDYLKYRQSLFADIKDLNEEIRDWQKEYKAQVTEERDQAFLDEEARKEARPLAQVMDDIVPPVGRGGIQPPKLDFTKWKDKDGFLGTLRMARETLDRNIADVMPPDQAAKVKKFLTDPIRKNETERTVFMNEKRADVKTKMQELGIKPRSKADELIQKVGEGKVSQDQVTKEAPGQSKAIMEGVTFFRKMYDDLLDTWNERRKEFGYPPVPKREDYFRHFSEISDVFQQIGAIGRGQDLPTEIAGITHIFKPGKSFSTAELARTGDKTVYSAMAGMDNYLETVSKQIWSMDSIARASSLIEYISEAARETSRYAPQERVEIPRVITNLRGTLLKLQYKKSKMDTGIVDEATGRKFYAMAELVKNRVAANMVGANIASALTNFIPLFTQLPATTSTKYFLQGLYEGAGAPLLKDPAMIDGIQSDFLRRRYPSDNLAPTKTQKAINALGIVFKAVDEFAGHAIVAAKYHENVAKGINKVEAMKNADEYAAKVIADRSFAQMPNLFSHKTLGFFTQFQLETNNLYSFLKKDVPEFAGHNGYKIFKKLLAFAVASYLFNELYEKIAGRRPTLDPIYDLLILSGIQPGTKDFSVRQRIGIVGRDLAGNIPFGNIIPGISSGRLPVSAFIPKNFTPMELARSTLSIVPPVGGGQVFKTIKGVKTYNQGYAETTAGKPSFAIKKSTANLLRELIFGPSSTPEADAYYKNLDAGSVKALTNPERPVYDHYQELKNAGKEDEAQAYLDEQYPDTPEGDSRYKDYVKVKAAVKAQMATENTDKYLTEILESGIVQKVLALQKAGKNDEADELVTNAFPDTPEGDAKYDAYKTAKTMLKAADIGFGSKPTTSWDKQSLAQHIGNIADAVGTHPIQFFDNVFHRAGDWKVTGIENGQVLVARLPLNASEAVKKQAAKDNADWKLDHTVPLEIGGSNRNSNLQLLTTEQWAAHTKVENYLGAALKNDEITGAQAREYMLRYKAGIGEPMSATLLLEYKKKYGGKPITFEEIQAAVEGK